METVKEGKSINKFAGTLISCPNCDGAFRLTDQDYPHPVASNPWNVSFRKKRGSLYSVVCPTKGCAELIQFVV